jgi:hypothetical protein
MLMLRAQPATDNAFGAAPTLAYDNVQVNLGSIISTTIGPWVQEAQKVAKPFQPVINILNAPIPGLSYISHYFGQGDITLLQEARSRHVPFSHRHDRRGGDPCRRFADAARWRRSGQHQAWATLSPADAGVSRFEPFVNHHKQPYGRHRRPFFVARSFALWPRFPEVT